MSLDWNVWGPAFASGESATGDARPIGGFRFCSLEEDGNNLRLTSLGGGSYWEPGVNVATCRVGRKHSAPQRACACGFYACLDLTALLKTVGPTDEVLCAVIGGGRVVVHERGWRAQYAEIIALCAYVPGRIVRGKDGRLLHVTKRDVVPPETLHEVARRYGVPAVPVAQLEDIVSSYQRRT